MRTALVSFAIIAAAQALNFRANRRQLLVQHADPVSPNKGFGRAVQKKRPPVLIKNDSLVSVPTETQKPANADESVKDASLKVSYAAVLAIHE